MHNKDFYIKGTIEILKFVIICEVKDLDTKIAEAELDEIFDGKASELYTGEYVLENWGKHEFTLGTWTMAFQSKKSIIKTLNIPLQKKVYFAGEIYDVHKQLGVPGAILSGYHSIDKLLME